MISWLHTHVTRISITSSSVHTYYLKNLVTVCKCYERRIDNIQHLTGELNIAQTLDTGVAPFSKSHLPPLIVFSIKTVFDESHCVCIGGNECSLWNTADVWVWMWMFAPFLHHCSAATLAGLSLTVVWNFAWKIKIGIRGATKFIWGKRCYAREVPW